MRHRASSIELRDTLSRDERRTPSIAVVIARKRNWLGGAGDIVRNSEAKYIGPVARSASSKFAVFTNPPYALTSSRDHPYLPVKSSTAIPSSLKRPAPPPKLVTNDPSMLNL